MADFNLADLFKFAPGFVAVLRSPRHVFEYVNPAYERLVGQRDFIGRTVQEAMPEVVAQGFLELLDQVYTSGEPYTAENVPVEIQNGPSSDLRFVSFVYQPIKNPAGEVTGIFCEGMDVTASAQAQFERQTAERQLQAVFNNASVAIFLMDDKQHCSYMNPAAERMTGYAFEETLGRPLHDVIHHTRPDGTAFPLHECAIDRAFPENNNVKGEEVFVHKDGHFYPVSFTASPVRDEESNTIGTIIEVQDISSRKEAEAQACRTLEELTEERRALELLNRTGSEVAAELDLEKVVQLVVDAGVELTGARFGAFFYNVEGDDGERLMLYTLSGAEVSDFEGFGLPRATPIFAPTFANEGVVRSPDITQDPRYGKNSPHNGMPKGHLPVRSYLAVPVVSRSSEVIGGLFFGHPDADIFDSRAEQIMTGLAAQAAIAIDNARLFKAARRANENLEQRVDERTKELDQANEALRQAQKMEAIGQLTGGIAHDFNNLLTVIRGSVDLLRRDDLPEDKRRRYVDAISDTADRAAKLTSQLLAFARRQALRPEVFDAAMRVHGIADMLRTIMGSRVRLNIEDECNDCFVEADLGQFETALVNLAVNARDAMEGAGDLTIRIGRSGPGASDMVEVAISDTGHGIPADQLERIFEPFFTTKDVGKGTGLGLSQVYGFIKQSDGDILVDSKVGDGTTITLTLPRTEVAAPAEQSFTASQGLPVSAGRVLIVEDNADVGEFACQLLSDLGFTATLASTAEEALSHLEPADASFDVVFSDVVMPGMGGLELGKIVREKWPNLPIVLTSGYSHVLAEKSRHGFPLLHKPYSVDGLAESLAEARRKHRHAS